jgi:iron complex outermembrane recepter protein
MLYARIAEGFVPGGPNNTFPGSTLPSSYNSSTTVNYEAGIKSILLDNHLSVELSVFYIDWRDIALTVSIDGLGAYANAGTARSQGSEWNFVYAPVGGLTLSLNGAYTEAYLTQVLPSVPETVGANVGNRLPFVPTWESSASAEYERRLGGGYSGFTGLSWRFTGTRDANFETAAARLQVPSFSIFDARAGVEKNSWAFTLYAKNIANKIAINYLSDETFSGSLGPQSAVLYQPRTIGATVTAKF